MNRYIGIAIAVFALIILDEIAFFVWRTANPGEHFSHIDTKDPLTFWEPWNGLPDKPLNRPQSGIFYHASG